MIGRRPLAQTQPAAAGGPAWVAVRSAACFLTAMVGALMLLVLGFRLGVLAEIPVLFYRGVILSVACAGLCGGLLALFRRALGVPMETAIASAAVALSFDLCFLTLGPVTFDRSNTVWILGYLERDSGGGITAEEMKRAFVEGYVGRLGQIDRRLQEQSGVGLVERRGDRYRISARGRWFVALERGIVEAFGIDPRIVEGGRADAANGRKALPEMLRARTFNVSANTSVVDRATER